METTLAAESISLQQEITDQDMVAELSKHHGEDRSQFAMLALKIGIQAVRMAAGGPVRAPECSKGWSTAGEGHLDFPTELRWNP